MSYTRTQWVESETPLSADNMNNIEDGIEELQDQKVDKVTGKGLSTNDYTTAEKNKLASVLSLVYPIGSIYMSVNSTNPGTLFGGTWVAWGSGRVPVGVNASDSSFDTVEETGGSKDAGQQEIYRVYNTGVRSISGAPSGMSIASGDVVTGVGAKTTALANGNLQPYITCYMWKRTA